jgi:putative transposase
MKNRKPTRSKAIDYIKPGSYFITTNVLNHQCCFGHIRGGKMIHNQYGKIAVQQFDWLSGYYEFLDVKIYVVMPNHVHAILDIKPLQGNIISRSISQLIGAYKARVSSGIRKQGLESFAWQRSFYDHLIRNEYSYDHIAAYIENNPLNWTNDRYYK